MYKLLLITLFSNLIFGKCIIPHSDKNTSTEIKFKQCIEQEILNDSDWVNQIAIQRIARTYKISFLDESKIVSSVLREAKQYNIDPVTLMSVLAKESSLRKTIEHSAVYVKVPTKRHWTEVKTAKVKAVGLGGVIFEIWKYELSDIGITKRKQLFNIESNIKATAMILSTYQHERKQIKGSVSREESALLRYYGVIRKSGKPIKVYSTQVYKIKNS